MNRNSWDLSEESERKPLGMGQREEHDDVYNDQGPSNYEGVSPGINYRSDYNTGNRQFSSGNNNQPSGGFGEGRRNYGLGDEDNYNRQGRNRQQSQNYNTSNSRYEGPQARGNSGGRYDNNSSYGDDFGHRAGRTGSSHRSFYDSNKAYGSGSMSGYGQARSEGNTQWNNNPRNQDNNLNSGNRERSSGTQGQYGNHDNYNRGYRQEFNPQRGNFGEGRRGGYEQGSLGNFNGFDERNPGNGAQYDKFYPQQGRNDSAERRNFREPNARYNQDNENFRSESDRDNESWGEGRYNSEERDYNW